MKINSINFKVSASFKGMPNKAPKRKIDDATDAIKQWEVLRHPQYTEIIQEEEVATPDEIKKAKQIREDNYSFLDEVKTDREKEKFISHFRQVTGFPILKDSTKKILDEYERVLRLASKEMDYARGTNPSKNSTDGILMAGYDEFCSVGQGSALPGSDLDKAFAIVEGPASGYMEDKTFSDRVKGHIWNNIDNRIMSVNHLSAFPNIMTFNELKDTIDKADYYASKFMEPKDVGYFGYQRLYNPYPVPASRFNIWLSQRIPSKEERYEMKNLAYVVESMRDGEKMDFAPYYNNQDIYNLMANSMFCNCSNIIQSRPMQDSYDMHTEDSTKSKLKARKQLEKEFDGLPTKEQYEIVNDVIRSMSGDSKNPELRKLFASKTDKHRLLINDILRGFVICDIVTMPDGGEQTFLSFNTPEAIEKYSNVNVYDI
ncbi:hypothetical protein IJ182_08755 [bacterium]|nr:hypothetical protein [bacterium]